MLLFLKSVERIEICSWTSPDEARPSVLFSCGIANMTPSLERSRCFVGEAVRVSNSKATLENSQQQQQQQAAAVEGIADFQLQIHCIDSTQQEDYDEVWEVCNQLGGGQCSVMAADPNNALLRLVPWGGVAAQVSSLRTSTGTHTEPQPGIATRTGGLAYCFLPLPVQTGLPVMVNGFFELSSNRRDVWQAGSDMEGDGRTRAEWNISLMRDVISPSYVRLLLRLRGPLGFSETFQNMWPSASLLAPWSYVADSTLRQCRSQRLLRRDADSSLAQPKIVSPSAVEDKSPRRSLFSSNKSKSEFQGDQKAPEEVDNLWLPCHQAVLLPDLHTGGLNSPDDLETLRSVLLGTGHAIVHCIPSLRAILINSNTCDIIATPAFTRDALRVKSPSPRQPPAQPLYTPPVSACRLLIRYCLSDMDATNPSIAMDGLPILPVADHSVGVLRIISRQLRQSILELTSMGFSETQARFALAKTDNDMERACDLLTSVDNTDDVTSLSSSAVYVICGEEIARIFSSAASVLLDTSQMGGWESEFMMQKEMGMFSNVKPFGAGLIPDILRKILPAACFQNTPVTRKALGSEQESIMAFLLNFWGYVCKHPEFIAAAAEGAAITPCRDGLLLPLSRLFDVIAPQRGDTAIPVGVLEILVKLGAHVLDEEALDTTHMPQVFWEYVHSSSRKGVLSVLESLLRQKSRVEAFDALTSAQREELFSYIACADSTSVLTGICCMCHEYFL